MKRILTSALLAVSASVFVLAGSTFASDDGRGKQVYEVNCQICHGARGDGNGSAAPNLTTPSADFTKSEFWRGRDDKTISAEIKNGKGEMPPYNLSAEDMKALIAYLHTAFEPKRR
jgi:mono/diheme cytochrome c family protein